VFNGSVICIILVLLIGIAAFGFILRSVEYLIITNEIERISINYRSIGFFQGVFTEEELMRDITDTVNFLGQSPFVAINDARKIAQGVLPQGMLSGNYHTIGAIVAPDGSRLLAPTYEAFFYGTVSSRIVSLNAVFLNIDVDYVKLGFPEHITAGQTILFTLNIDGAGALFSYLREDERYLFRGVFNTPPGIAGRTPDINLEQPFIIMPLDNVNMWFEPVPEGQVADLTAAHMAGVAEQIDILDINLRAMSVEGTRDASALPLLQPETNHFSLLEGRLINYTDYVDRNPVANVTRHFARYNGLEVGDKIIIDLRDNVHSVIFTFYPEHDDWRSFETYEGLELEIVGIFDMRRLHGETNDSTLVFVPYSVLPDSFTGFLNNSIITIYYSFVLDSPMNQAAFIHEYRNILTEMGHTLLFIDNDAENFATSTYPIRQSARINLVLFAIMTAAILFLVIFIYLRQCRKNFAIARAMGIPSKKLRGQMLMPVLIFWIPSVVIIGRAAWRYAHNVAAETLTALADFDVDIIATLPPVYFTVLALLIVVIIIIAVVAGSYIATRRPVLALLQETVSRRTKNG
jgi:hypothetical protein